VKEVWNEYKREEYTMHAMLFTTINGNPAHPNLSGQSKRKGAGCPHCLKDTCVVWLRHSKKYIFMGHHHFLGKKHPYRAMDCQFNGEKENREAPLHTNNHTSMSLEMQNHTHRLYSSLIHQKVTKRPSCSSSLGTTMMRNIDIN
jgi:hypothetical protein